MKSVIWILLFTLAGGGMLQAALKSRNQMPVVQQDLKERFTGFVKIREDRELFVDWAKAAPGQPTVVLLNGLTYTTQQWERFTLNLIATGVGVVRFDPNGMGQTLLHDAPLVQRVAIEDQARDLRDLVIKLELPQPVSVAGLSYGGGLAVAFASTYPAMVGKVILMAPYTEPLAEQDQWIRSQIDQTRQLNPRTPLTDDEIYDFFLRQIVYLTYPKAEPIVLENPYKLEAVYQMARGIRQFQAQLVAAKLPKNSVHLVIAGADQYVKRSVLLEFWKTVPEDARQSLLVINNTEHKIPEAVPRFSAGWVQRILRNEPLTQARKDCEADPLTGWVRCAESSIKIPGENGG